MPYFFLNEKEGERKKKVKRASNKNIMHQRMYYVH